MKLSFTKMQGAGNDFVVVDATRERFRPEAGFLARLTDRRFGVGCDQVLVVEAPSETGVDFNYRIFNADGREVGQCGNGARALARFVRERGLSDKVRLRVQTSTSILTLEHLAGGQIRVDMGKPRFSPAEIPLSVPIQARRYRLKLASGLAEFGAVSMGNPHAVLRVDDIDRAPVEVFGRELQARPEFGQGVNVGFLQVLDSDNGRLRVYERGSGETLACGSGACAAVAIGRLWGLFGERVELQLRGGTLIIEWAGTPDAPVLMTGPAETVFTGELEW